MTTGYLGLLTDIENDSELITLTSWDQKPENENHVYSKNIRYIARFDDILAAQMHFHNAMRKHLHEVDTHTYRADLIDAIAVIEAEDDLRHERIWIDPDISNLELQTINTEAQQRLTHKKNIDRVIQIIGFAAVSLLVIMLLLNFL
jgi:hypothetical protein